MDFIADIPWWGWVPIAIVATFLFLLVITLSPWHKKREFTKVPYTNPGHTPVWEVYRIESQAVIAHPTLEEMSDNYRCTVCGFDAGVTGKTQHEEQASIDRNDWRWERT